MRADQKRWNGAEEGGIGMGWDGMGWVALHGARRFSGRFLNPLKRCFSPLYCIYHPRLACVTSAKSVTICPLPGMMCGAAVVAAAAAAAAAQLCNEMIVGWLARDSK